MPLPPPMQTRCGHASRSAVTNEQNRGYRCLAAGFSLVEVTLTIGILSFGLLSIMGLFPVGLQALHQATDQVTESQIMQKLSGEMLLTPFSQLETRYDQGVFYFSEEGNLLPTVDGARYKVLSALADPVYPGSSNMPVSSVVQSIQTIQVDIVQVQSGAVANRFSIQVPNSGNSQ